MTLAQSLIYAALHGCAFLGDPWHVQNVLRAMDQGERTRLIEATTIRFPNHARRLADGLGDGMAGDTQKNSNS